MDDPDTDVADLRSRSPGDDPADPYEDVDVSVLPAWWQRAIEEFDHHDLRPYRPPRFADGTLKHEVVGALEAEFGVEITVRGMDATKGDDWTVYVDGEPAGAVGHRRSAAGYSVFEVESRAFERLVREAVE